VAYFFERTLYWKGEKDGNLAHSKSQLEWDTSSTKELNVLQDLFAQFLHIQCLMRRGN